MIIKSIVNKSRLTVSANESIREVQTRQSSQLMFHTTRIKQVIVDDLEQLQQHVSIPEKINYRGYIQENNFSKKLLVHEDCNNESKHSNAKIFKKSLKDSPVPHQTQKAIRRKVKEKKSDNKQMSQTINLEMFSKSSTNKISKHKNKKYSVCQPAIRSFHKKNNKSLNIDKSNKIKSPSPQLLTYRDSCQIPNSIHKNNYFSDDFSGSCARYSKIPTVKKRVKSFMENNNAYKKIKSKSHGQHNCSKKTTKIKQQLMLKPGLSIQRIISMLKSNNSLYPSDVKNQQEIQRTKTKKVLLTQFSQELIKDMKKTKEQVQSQQKNDRINQQNATNDKLCDSEERCNTESLIQMYIAMINQKIQLNEGILISQNEQKHQFQLPNQQNIQFTQLQLQQQPDLKTELKKWHEMLSYFEENIKKNENGQVVSCLKNFLHSADKQLKQILINKFGDKSILQNLHLHHNLQDYFNVQGEGPVQQEKFMDSLNQLEVIPMTGFDMGYYKIRPQQHKSQNKNSMISQHEQMNQLQFEIVNQREETQFSSTQDFSEYDFMNDLIRISSMDRLLKNQIEELKEKRDKDLLNLENQYEEEIIICSSHPQFQNEKNKLQKWYKIELRRLNKARKDIWKGYNQFKNLMDKVALGKSIKLRDRQQKILRSLSAQYLYNKSNFHNVQIEQQTNARQIVQIKNSQENNSEPIERIKEKLVQIKRNRDMCPDNQQQSMDYQYVNQHFPDANVLNQQNQLKQSSIKLQRCNQNQKEVSQLSLNENDLQVVHDTSNNKFKYINYEDKEDIFQFIFLDLCIELYQEQCTDNSIMKIINQYIQKQKIIKSRRKGVKTNLSVVKQYLKRFQAFVLRSNKSCILSVNLPIGPSAQQMLRYLRQSDYLIDEQQNIVAVVIPIQTFDKFQSCLLSSLQIERINEDDKEQEKRQQFLKNILHIHNKAIFDCLNEYLDLQRPFKLMGTPFPWKTSPEVRRQITEQQALEKLLKASNNVVDCCSYICGILFDKQDSLFGNNKNISEDYIQSLRQDRLSRMLANDLLQNQIRWLFIDDEEAEVLMQLYRYVSRQLLEQIVSQIRQMIQK